MRSAVPANQRSFRYTYQTLEPFEELRPASRWGAPHQKRLNGTGYPFGFDNDDLPLGAGIMAVADAPRRNAALGEHGGGRHHDHGGPALRPGCPHARGVTPWQGRLRWDIGTWVKRKYDGVGSVEIGPALLDIEAWCGCRAAEGNLT
ncbi:HD domain-containing phosphohydrolase [Desulfosarcina ovata]|uniref:HD domain-containing phosphohydrolase n=1 Tax=Desulfosarcina ovata TaxID=83564 RepID=UPI0012D2CD09|nr:HD domain-containing phosphohydrolase [Desulfosarcina ovata]